jgi:hypothetical protein
MSIAYVPWLWRRRCRRTNARKGEHRSGAWEAQAAIAASSDGACPTRMIPLACMGAVPQRPQIPPGDSSFQPEAIGPTAEPTNPHRSRS